MLNLTEKLLNLAHSHSVPLHYLKGKQQPTSIMLPNKAPNSESLSRIVHVIKCQMDSIDDKHVTPSLTLLIQHTPSPILMIRSGPSVQTLGSQRVQGHAPHIREDHRLHGHWPRQWSLLLGQKVTHIVRSSPLALFPGNILEALELIDTRLAASFRTCRFLKLRLDSMESNIKNYVNKKMGCTNQYMHTLSTSKATNAMGYCRTCNHRAESSVINLEAQFSNHLCH
jgi:hypothetical protein